MRIATKLKALTVRKKIVLILALPLIATTAFLIRDARAQSVSAIDHLFITYNGTSTPDPIFTSYNMLPGDCVEEEFIIEHQAGETTNVNMRTYHVIDPYALSTQMSIEIEDGNGVIYGGTSSPKTLQQFFSDTNWSTEIDLGTFNGIETKTYTATVCFDPSSGNEYQNTFVRFNIKFVEDVPPLPLPEECSDLTGIVTNVIEGTPGNDFIIGTPKGDLIKTYGGNDTIFGRRGNDCIVSGDGDDYVASSSGNDIIVGGNGNDTIYAESGHDLVLGGNGNDRIYASSGNDVVWAGEGNDFVDGGSQEDALYGENGNDTLQGRSGHDYLDGGNGTDFLNGSSGIDTCINGEPQIQCEF